MALRHLWLFWVAPIVGAVAAGFASRLLYEEKSSMEPTTETIAPGAAA